MLAIFGNHFIHIYTCHPFSINSSYHFSSYYFNGNFLNSIGYLNFYCRNFYSQIHKHNYFSTFNNYYSDGSYYLNNCF